MAVTLTFHSPAVWARTALGAGGWVTDVETTGGTGAGHYQYCRCDTQGAYKRAALGGTWQPILNSATLPNDPNLNDPIAIDALPYGSYGVYEIKHAPSDPTRAYMVWQNRVIVSNDSMATWQDTNFGSHVQSADPNGGQPRYYGNRLAVDPINKNVVYFGPHYEGLLYTFDGFATAAVVQSAITPPTLLAPDSERVGVQICFDPNTGAAIGGRTRRIWAFSHGQHNKRSDDAGATWTTIAGGPDGVRRVVCASNGDLYATAQTKGPSNKVWRWNNAGSAWVDLSTGTNFFAEEWQAVCVHPSNPALVTIFATGGAIQQSTNSGATWSDRFGYIAHATSADIPWLATSFTDDFGNMNSYLSIGNACRDPSDATKFIQSMGVGVLVATVGNPFTHEECVSESVAIEQLCVNEINSSPNGHVLYGVQDRGCFAFNSSNPNTFKSRYASIDTQTGVTHCWSTSVPIDNPALYVGVISYWGEEHSGYGPTDNSSWTRFPQPIALLGGSPGFGNIAAGSSTNFVWVLGSTARQPIYTTNAGAAWAACTFAGLGAGDLDGYMNGQFGGARKTLQADTVNANTFYCWHSVHGLYRSTDSGANFSKRIDRATVGMPAYGLSPYAVMKAVPGQVGKLLWAPGRDVDYAASFYLLDAVAGTASVVPGVTGVYQFGLGAPAPGQTVPSVIMAASVGGITSAQRGIWVTDDWFTTFRRIGGEAINGHIDRIITLDGNRAIYGKVYVGFSGSGGYYGTFT